MTLAEKVVILPTLLLPIIIWKLTMDIYAQDNKRTPLWTTCMKGMTSLATLHEQLEGEGNIAV